MGDKQDKPIPPGARLLGTVFYVVGVVIFVWVMVKGVTWWLAGRITEPITTDPIAHWEPVVNPIGTHHDGGYVPALYRVNLDDGTTCYLAYGITDDLECVR